MKNKLIIKMKRKYSKFYKSLDNNQQRLLKVLEFLIIFNLLAIPLQVIIHFNVNLYQLAFIERTHVSVLLDLFGIKHYLTDLSTTTGMIPAINLNDKILAIGEPCTAFRSILAFSALVIASPRDKNYKKKALMLIPIIYVFNVLRITSLAMITISNPSLFELLHVVLWREGLVFLILILWYYWFSTSQNTFYTQPQ